MGKGGEFGSIPPSIWLGGKGTGLVKTLSDGQSFQNLQVPLNALAALADAEHAAANGNLDDWYQLKIVCDDINTHADALYKAASAGDREKVTVLLTGDFVRLKNLFT